MHRRYKVTAAAAVLGACCFAYYWYGGTPRTGARPQLPGAAPVSIEISISGRPLTTITNAAGLNSVMEMLRSGRSVEMHKCKNQGIMVLHFADGHSLRVSFLPGHHFMRYEFGTPDGLFTVSRSRFLEALRAAGVDVQKISSG